MAMRAGGKGGGSGRRVNHGQSPARLSRDEDERKPKRRGTRTALVGANELGGGGGTGKGKYRTSRQVQPRKS